MGRLLHTTLVRTARVGPCTTASTHAHVAVNNPASVSKDTVREAASPRGTNETMWAHYFRQPLLTMGRLCAACCLCTRSSPGPLHKLKRATRQSNGSKTPGSQSHVSTCLQHNVGDQQLPAQCACCRVHDRPSTAGAGRHRTNVGWGSDTDAHCPKPRPNKAIDCKQGTPTAQVRHATRHHNEKHLQWRLHAQQLRSHISCSKEGVSGHTRPATKTKTSNPQRGTSKFMQPVWGSTTGCCNTSQLTQPQQACGMTCHSKCAQLQCAACSQVNCGVSRNRAIIVSHPPVRSMC